MPDGDTPVLKRRYSDSSTDALIERAQTLIRTSHRLVEETRRLLRDCHRTRQGLDVILDSVSPRENK